MIIIYSCLVVFAIEAAVLRGRLIRLTSLRIRRLYLVWIALANEVLVIAVLPGHQSLLFACGNALSYVAGGAFVWCNRRIPGLALIACGGALNLTAMAANGGVMPASAKAMAASGWRQPSGHFANSAVLAHPRLAFLGDIFATPRWAPGHDVFSVGDVIIVVAFGLLVYRVCTRLSTASNESITVAAPQPS